MKESAKYNLHTNLPAMIFYLVEIPLYIYFLSPGNELISSLIPLWLGLTAVTILLHNLLMRKHYKLAMTDVDGIRGDSLLMDRYLVGIGAMPLKNLALYVGIVLLHQGGFFLILTKLSRTPMSETGLFCGLIISLGLLAAGFIYVSLDNYVIDLLYKKQITYFPTDKRINRQKAKAIIIPSYMTIMTFLVTSSLVYLSLLKTPGIPAEAKKGILSLLIGKSFIPQLFYLIVGLGLVFNAAVNTSKLFSNILVRLEDMVSRDKNLTRRIHISSVDEMASIGRFINIFSSLIADHIRETGEVYGHLDTNHKKLSRSINESSQHISDITDRLDDTIESVRSMDSIVSESIETGKSLIENVNTTVRFVESQSSSVEESSAAVEEMIASISEVSRRTELVKENTLRLADSFGKGEESVKNTITSISGVAELSQNILSVNKLISGIAAQTNLLAMNAAIEAAHAGDAGRGFSVVADEIRKLAENTSAHIKTSGESLKSIMQEIQSSLNVAKETGVIFNEMKSGILHIQDESLSIADSMSEHDKANRQVLEQLVETKDIAFKLNSIAEKLSSLGSSMMDAFRQLEINSESSLQNAGIMMERSSQIRKSVDELTSVAAATESINQKTRELITAFTID